MKNSILIVCALVLIFTNNRSSAQPTNLGLFRSLKVTTGFTATAFYNPVGEYKYILQQDASVKERATNHFGAALSIVILFPLDSSAKNNLLLNISFLDIKSETTLFNSQTPFGLGYAHFFGKSGIIGVCGMINFGRQKRKIETDQPVYFPVANYTNSQGVQTLHVGAAVPDAIMEPYLENVTTISFNTGLIIRF